MDERARIPDALQLRPPVVLMTMDACDFNAKTLTRRGQQQLDWDTIPLIFASRG